MACWALSVLWELRASCRKKAVTESLEIASKRWCKYLLVFSFRAPGCNDRCYGAIWGSPARRGKQPLSTLWWDMGCTALFGKYIGAARPKAEPAAALHQ